MKKFIAAVVATAAIAFGIGTQQSDTNLQYLQPVPVKVITSDGKDLDIYVDPKTNKKVTDFVPVAPLMTWTNSDISLRRPMVWCTDGIDPTIRPVAKDLITKLYDRYGLPYSFSCPAPYTFADTAQIDCGIGDGAVACAVYNGPTSGKVSYNGNMWRDGRCRIGCIRSALAHEIGHIFNLDHTPCNNPEPSTMSPIYLPDGPACATKSPDYSWEDYKLAEDMYRLRPNDPNVPRTFVRLQRWIESGREPCTTPSGSWCIQTTESIEEKNLSVKPWYVIVLDQDGMLSYPSGFVEVGK